MCSLTIECVLSHTGGRRTSGRIVGLEIRAHLADRGAGDAAATAQGRPKQQVPLLSLDG